LGRFGVKVERTHLGLKLEKFPPRVPDEVAGNFHSVWRDWVHPHADEFAQVYLQNRVAQAAVKSWIDPEVVQNSLWRYGLTRLNWRTEISDIDAVDRTITYTDLLVFLSRYLKDPRYLEIGVSTGKNFYQVSQRLRNALLVGLDIETINPRLQSLFSDEQLLWESDRLFPFSGSDGQVVDKRFTLAGYTDPATSNAIHYLSGDKFQEATWEPLSGKRFNLVFSDACHEPESLRTEMEYMLRHDVLDDQQLIMLWDDLGGDMTKMFLRVTDQLNARFPDCKPYRSLFRIPGTYGGTSRENGRLHMVGLYIHDAGLRQD
jgi:hypothetical protein